MESIVYMPVWANIIFACAIVLLIIALLWRNFPTIAEKVKNIPLDLNFPSFNKKEEELSPEYDAEGRQILRIRRIVTNKIEGFYKTYKSKTIAFSDGGCVEAPYGRHSIWRAAKKGDKVIKEGDTYRPL